MAQIQTKFIATNAVTNPKLAQMSAHTYKGNNTGSTANALDVTSTQLTADLNLFSSSLQGLVPSSGGGTANFLRADGTFAVPPGTGLSTTLTNTHIYVGNASNVATDVALSGDATLANTGALTLGSHVVSNAKFRQSAAQSVVGNSTNATADVADISASAADQILRANGAGTAIAFGSIDLSKSGAVGASILAIANGGTGQATANAAFAALSPMTTAGDLIYENATPLPARLPIGSSGQVLTVSAGLPAWATPSVSLLPKQENITLSGTDITNQYIDLAFAAYGASASDNSINLAIVGGPEQLKTVDYTVALTGGSGGVTRITFAGDLATGGNAALIAADILMIYYMH